MKTKKRCDWAESSEQMRQYHDTEWGVPLYDDNKLFEYLILDTFQAGLSWSTILQKRESFRKAFSNFNPKKIALFTKKDISRLMKDEGIVRNRLKITGAITNARAFLALQKEQSFSSFVWSFTGGKVVKNTFKNIKELPETTEEAILLSKELKKRGFTFVGPTITYAFMQASGIVDDHLNYCFVRKEKK